MRAFFMLVGMLLAFLGVVSASPTGTPTTPEGATPASLGLRRNGFSDLPSDVIGYNGVQPENRIPDYVVANDPDEGNDAIIYTREEIYTAMQQGYEVLQRTRDPEPGAVVEFANVEYPSYIRPDVEELSYTHFGQFGLAEDLEMYAWPLLWTNSYTGWNQNPGFDRVVFNENGIYLGVITRRPSESSPGGGYRWCPPTNGYGRWISRWVGGHRGWEWTGVPPDGSAQYMPPSQWNIASSQRQIWWDMNPGGMPPVGSVGAVVNSSNSSPVNMTSPDTSLDHDNPLQFPPLDNSTGTWQTYVPGNLTANLTHELVAKDCKFAHDHGVAGYHQSCQTHWPGGSSMQVRITISGTGQNNKGWCQGIIDNMKKNCGGVFNLLDGIYSCNTAYPGTVTFSSATDPDDPGHDKYYYGIDLHFWLQWPWEESDADHKCMSSAVEAASCAGADVKSYSGKFCRNVDWRPQPPLLEWSNDMGPA